LLTKKYFQAMNNAAAVRALTPIKIAAQAGSIIAALSEISANPALLG
jgi:hypothetical protein